MIAGRAGDWQGNTEPEYNPKAHATIGCEMTFLSHGDWRSARYLQLPQV